MEPQWQPEQQSRQGVARPATRHDEGECVQQPLGTARQPRYQAPYARQPWQNQPTQSSPAPVPSNLWKDGAADPFDEPAEAPELRSQRSDHLYNREDRFWEQVEAGKKTGRHDSSAGKAKAESHTLRWVILILAVLVAVGGLVYGAVFQVREISVQGISTLTEEEVIRLSGISVGMNTFAIDDDQVEKNIESNRYLSFVCVDKQLPDKVVIQVKERVPTAAVKYCGILYTMDNRGMVLEESLDTSSDIDLLLVSGLDIHNCRVGTTLGLNDSQQMLTFTEILIELKVMSGLERMKELDLSNMDNLFMVSRDGFTVRLGPADSLHARLRSMLITLEHLRQEGYSGGTLDVSTPLNPTYIPES